MPDTKANGALRRVLPGRQPVAAFSYTTVEDYPRFLVGLLADQALLGKITDSQADVDPGLSVRWGLG